MLSAFLRHAPRSLSNKVGTAVQESRAAAEQKSSSQADDKEVAASESLKQAAQHSSAVKQSSEVKQEQGKARVGDSDSDVEILEEEAPEKGSHSGFYRAIRETGRANVLLALQVHCMYSLLMDAPAQSCNNSAMDDSIVDFCGLLGAALKRASDMLTSRCRCQIPPRRASG